MSFAHQAGETAAVVRFLHAQGWAPATSSNYSFRVEGGAFAVSRSGVDKGAFTAEDFLVLSPENGFAPPPGVRPSAETDLHRALYDWRADIGAVLHTHSIYNTVLSRAHAAEGGLALEGFELLKGLRGVASHETKLWLPIFPNTQDIPALAADVTTWLNAHPDAPPGYLIAGHGLYAWGETIAEAKRHIETFEFILECIYKLKTYGYPHHS